MSSLLRLKLKDDVEKVMSQSYVMLNEINCSKGK